MQVQAYFTELVLKSFMERRDTLRQRSAGPFPTGLPDEEIMHENVPERPDRVRVIIIIVCVLI